MTSRFSDKIPGVYMYLVGQYLDRGDSSLL